MADQGARTGRRLDRRFAVSLLGVVVLLVAGVALIVVGARDHGRTAHGQPLPPRPFAIEPAAARALPAPAALVTPQPGSRQRSCRPQAGRAEVDIPALCIYAALVPSHIDETGALPVPTDVHQVAQDMSSAAWPAKTGTTVIAGHVDDANQGDGAFYFLHQAQPGTEIVVTGLDGTVTTWKVFSVTSVHKDRLPADLFGTTGPRRLVLVTCGGQLVYRPGSGNTYAENVLVYATPARP